MYFYLDENRTLIYSPSGTYFRIQDKRVHEKLTDKYIQEFGIDDGLTTAKERSYVTVTGGNYENIYRKVSEKYNNLSESELSKLVSDKYQQMTHYKDKR